MFILWIRYKLFEGKKQQQPTSGALSVILRSAAAILPGNFLEKKILKPTWIRYSRGRAQLWQTQRLQHPLTFESQEVREVGLHSLEREIYRLMVRHDWLNYPVGEGGSLAETGSKGQGDHSGGWWFRLTRHRGCCVVSQAHRSTPWHCSISSLSYMSPSPRDILSSSCPK